MAAIIIEAAGFQSADDGNTTHYGGTVEVNGKQYQVSGDDRSDVMFNNVVAFTVLNELMSLGGYPAIDDDAYLNICFLMEERGSIEVLEDGTVPARSIRTGSSEVPEPQMPEESMGIQLPSGPGEDYEYQQGYIYTADDGSELVLIDGVARGGATLWYWDPTLQQLFYHGEDPSVSSDHMVITTPEFRDAQELAGAEPRVTGRKYEGEMPTLPMLDFNEYEGDE